MRVARPLPGNLSHSQLSSYIECGERYRLERLYQLPKSIWWSTVFGTAMHQMTEDFDRGCEVGPWLDYLNRAHDDETVGKNVRLRPSGPVRKAVTWNGGPGKRDRDWCEQLGPQVFEAYQRWRDVTDWDVLEVFDAGTAGFVPAIELEWTTKVGGVTVRGVIDRVFDHPDHGPLILDLKFGARGTSSSLQLKVYRLGLLRDWGVESARGMFLSPYIPKGADDDRPEMGGRIDMLDPADDGYIENLYRKARVGMQAGVFLPNTDTCTSCAVTEWCRAKNGLAVGEIPITEEKE